MLYADMQGVVANRVYEICVEGKNFDIKIDAGSFSEDVQCAMVNKSFGYVRKSKAQAGIDVRFDEGTGTLTFTISEPEGWLSTKKCYVVIVVPKSLVERNVDVDVRTVKGDVSIGGENQLSFGKVNIASAKGEINLTNLNISKELGVNIGSGLIFVDEKCTANNIDVNIKLGSGEIDFTKINEFEIKSFRIEEIKTGIIRVLKAWEVVTAGTIRGGGRIEVGQVVELEILTLDTDIKIGTIGELGSEKILTSRIDITGNGDVEVLRVYSALQITGHNGNVKIGTATGTVTISTNQGNIDITDAYENISVDTQYGNANIQFSEDAPQYANGGRVLVAGTKNGHIISKGVQNANITIRDKGRATIEYDFVRGENRIIANKIGNIYITVPYEGLSIALDLYVESEVAPDVKLGTVTSEQLKPNNGKYTLDVDGIYGNNIHNASLRVESSTGNVKIRSRDLINF